MNYLTITQCLALPGVAPKQKKAGINLNSATLRNACIREQIPGAVQPGRDWLIPREAFLEWLAGWPHKPGVGVWQEQSAGIAGFLYGFGWETNKLLGYKQDTNNPGAAPQHTRKLEPDKIYRLGVRKLILRIQLGTFYTFLAILVANRHYHQE